jgi:hypothetical protein
MPFLSVITRHFPERADFLALNQASLRVQSDPDYEQILKVDVVGRGWNYAQEMLVDGGKQAQGAYVMGLDDDDCMINGRGIELMKDAAHDGPAMIVWRSWYLKIIPSDLAWMMKPVFGQIGTLNFALRRDIWQELVPQVERFPHDFWLARLVWDRYADEIAWLDELVCFAMRRSEGKK